MNAPNSFCRIFYLNMWQCGGAGGTALWLKTPATLPGPGVQFPAPRLGGSHQLAIQYQGF